MTYSSRWRLAEFLTVLTITMMTMNCFSFAERSNNVYDGLVSKVRERGSISVIVALKIDNFKPEGELSEPAVMKQRAEIKRLQEGLLTGMASFNISDVVKYQFIPYIAMTVDETALMHLINSPDVQSLNENKADPPTRGNAIK